MEFTLNHSLLDVLTCDSLKQYSQYLLYQNPAMSEQAGPDGAEKMPLSAMREVGWSPEGILAGINFLVELTEKNRVKQYFIYNEGEKTSPQMEYVNLIHLMPEKLAAEKPTILLCAGGGYFCVCTMVEALPTARHFVEQGYQVFVLTYRVAEPAVAPLALDDLGRAVRYLNENSETLHVDPNKVVIGGFSAGANLISNWGTTNAGYKAYGMPKPLALMPVYTFIDLKEEAKKDPEGGLIVPMYGPNYMDVIDKYNIAAHIDAEYPPCYLVCGRNDNTVPPRNSELFKELLDRAGVPAILEEGENAPHGFGDGTGTDVEGWPERAMQFLEGRFPLG